MKHKWWIRSAAVLVVMSLAACGGTQEATGGLQEPPKALGGAASSVPAKDDKQTKYPLTLKDASGAEMTFEKAPERIISLSPAETEVLFALGLGDRIVGVTKFCDYPAEAKSKPQIGTLQGNAEAIIAAKPDVVIGGVSTSKKTIDSLRGYSLPVFAVDPKDFNGVYERILLVGKVTNSLAKAEELVASMKAEEKKVADAVAKLKPEERKKVYIEFAPGWTVGTGEYMNEIITKAGAVNIAGDQKGYFKFSEEKIIQSNPDVIIYSTGPAKLLETIQGRSGWSKITAVEQNKFVAADDNMISRPGPRLTKALEQVAKGIYPDLVK